MKNMPTWIKYTLLGVIAFVALVGACNHYVGPIYTPTANPTVLPAKHPTATGPVLGLAGRPDPNTVWRTLEPPNRQKSAAIELPTTIEVPVSQRYIMVAARCNNDVKWLVSSTTGKTIEVLESPLTNSIMVFPNPSVSDVIAVLAYTSSGDKPTDAVITFIRVLTDKPPPTPPIPVVPTPPIGPVSKATKFHVTFVLDKDRQTRAISDIVNNKDLRTWLKDNGHQIHELSIKADTTVETGNGFDAFIKGKPAPLLVIQDADGDKPGTIEYADVLTDLTQVQNIISKLLSK